MDNGQRNWRAKILTILSRDLAVKGSEEMEMWSYQNYFFKKTGRLAG